MVKIRFSIRSSKFIVFVLVIQVFTQSLFFLISDEQITYAESIPYMSSYSEMPDYEKRKIMYEDIWEKNHHTVGWIYIKGTKVDNIIMQNKEEKDYYIDKDFNGDYYYPGTLYISDISDLTEPSDVVIMYGHNMKDRSMFGSLRNFQDPEFLKKYDIITVDNLNVRMEYEVTHVMRIRVNVEGGDDFPYYRYSNFEGKEEFTAFMKECDKHALYDSGKTAEYGDKLIMLTTCEYTYEDGSGRLVVMGKKQDLSESDEPVKTIAPAAEPDTFFSLVNLLIVIGSGILIIMMIILLRVLQSKRK